VGLIEDNAVLLAGVAIGIAALEVFPSFLLKYKHHDDQNLTMRYKNEPIV